MREKIRGSIRSRAGGPRGATRSLIRAHSRPGVDTLKPLHSTITTQQQHNTITTQQHNNNTNTAQHNTTHTYSHSQIQYTVLFTEKLTQYLTGIRLISFYTLIVLNLQDFKLGLVTKIQAETRQNTFT